jgi:peptidoglycan/LPS O-acetylase OafA/YrhL
MSTTQSNNFFPFLQALRALAALLVVVGHSQYEAYSLAQGGGQSFEMLSYPFGLGVHIFFVISGFVIAYTSARYADVKGGCAGFAYRRFIRVVPRYWFYTSLMIGVILIAPQLIDTAKPDVMHFIKSYLFIPHERPSGGVRPVLSLGWTLNYEIFFYAAFAALLFLPYKKLIKSLYAVFFVLALLGFLIPHSWAAVDFWTKPIILEFIIGVFIADLCLRNIRLSGRSAILLCFIALCASLSLIVSFPAFGIHHPYHIFIKGCIGGCLVAAATLHRFDKPPMGMVMSSFVGLGNSSYSLYLAHPFILGVAVYLWGHLNFFDTISLWVFVVLAVLSCVIGAHIAYILIEKPLLKLLNKKKHINKNTE